MAVPRPRLARSPVCCCGCSLELGVWMVLLFHLAVLLTSCVSGFIAVLYEVWKPEGIDFSFAFGYGMDPFWKVVVQMFFLAGIVLVLCGIHGTWSRSEPHVRVYWHYLIVSFLLDIGFLFYALVIEDPCDHMSNLVTNESAEFICGISRVWSALLVSILFLLQGYFVYTVWCFCEVLREDEEQCVWLGGAWLTQEEAAIKDAKKKQAADKRQSVFDAVYGGLDGFGGSVRLFSGAHEVPELPA